MAVYGIPSTLKEFTKQTKSVTSNNDSRFKSLFAAIKDNTEMKSLKMALNYLLENQYCSDVIYLKDIINNETASEQS